MALTPGTRFGPYEIVEQIGSGGMGEVWRARDTQLRRDVAVKALPEAFAADVDRVARFRQEAEVLASLSHPNIATIHGLEQAEGATVIVMELVEGPTLADRIEEGPIPADEAIGIAMQIAAALEASHGRQIVHRDLKPANIKLTTDGTVKVLDFGISKPIDPHAISGGPAAMTTPAMTQTGMILGTAAYMSPEQARGKPVDQRTDIWAFGCLLFEMLTGQPAFGGEDVMLTLARVLDRDTDLTPMPGSVAPAVRHTISLCLEKDPRRRIADIRDVRLALEGVFESGAKAPTALSQTSGTGRQRVLPIAASAAIAALLVGVAAWSSWPEADEPRVTRFSYTIPDDQLFRRTAVPVLDVAPDGRSFVYNTAHGLVLREFDQLETRVISGSEMDMGNPVYSPDGRSLAVFGTDEVLRIPVAGGSPLSLARIIENRLGLSWSADDSILYADLDGIWRVRASGGAPELLITADSDAFLFSPRLLPDGQTVLFGINESDRNNFETAQIAVRSLDTNENTVLINGGVDARYVPTGHLVYAVGSDLFGVGFDVQTLSVLGNPARVLPRVSRSDQSAGLNLAIADDGTLVYLSASADQTAGEFSLVWVDRDGRETPMDLAARSYGFVRVSPQGDRLAALVNGTSNADIWVSDLSRQTLNPVTFTADSEFIPLWSADGGRIVYPIVEGALQRAIYSTLADGTGEPELLLTLETGLLSTEGWSPDGTEIVFTFGTTQGPSIGLLSVEEGCNGQCPWRPLIDRASDASMLSISPDGEWIAYQSDASGDYGIYIERFPELGNRQAVSDEKGGWAPVWSFDGGELYYRRLGDGAMMAVPVQTGASLEIGSPEMLFPSKNYEPLITPQAGAPAGRFWDVAPDGRFLMIKSETGEESRELIVVQNWFEELKRLVPID